MPVKLSLSPDRHGEWRVSLDDTVIVCFSGPSAREQALRRSQELAELLHDTADVSDESASDDLRPFPTTG
ncbi:MAG TPA: hypothetical protein VM032_13860 [Vicinamibacterales bacterium]|nr:hypothetical protein [Vicinamibacterales bacterium]